MTMQRRSFIALSASAVAAAALPGIALPAAAAPPRYTEVIGQGSYQPHRLFGRGYYDQIANKTFVAWAGANMDVMVSAFDHRTKAWSTPRAVAIGRRPVVSGSYHDYTALVRLPDGRPGVFTCWHTRSAQLSTAPQPHSIDGEWQTEQISSDKNCYPMPVVVGDQTHFMYSRNDDLSWPIRTYRMISSSDSGRTWSSPRTLIDSRREFNGTDEVYAFDRHVHGSRIYLTWSMWGTRGRHAGTGRGLYCAYLDTETSTMFSAHGQELGPTVLPEHFDALRVRDTQPEGAITHPIRLSSVTTTASGDVAVTYSLETPAGMTGYLSVPAAGGGWQHREIREGMVVHDAATQGSSVHVAGTIGSQIVELRSTNLGSSWREEFAVDFPAEADAAGTDFLRVGYIDGHKGALPPGKPIRLLGVTAIDAVRRQNYDGEWPVFVVRR